MAADLLSTIRTEIDNRLSELRPLFAEYEQLLGAADALLDTEEPPIPVSARAPRVPRRAVTRRRTPPATPPSAAGQPAKAPRAPRGAAREAILAALDHGSHTVGELTVVTAMTGPNVNGNLRRLVAEGAVVKTEREGKTAYALPASG